MNITKIYFYPIVFSYGFLVSWNTLVMIINTFSSSDGYGGLGLGLLILFVWLIVAIPIYCIRYSKIIVDEKSKFSFTAYNSVLMIIAHMLPFSLQGETMIIIIFILWVLFWNIVPLICRLVSRRQEEKDSEYKG